MKVYYRHGYSSDEYLGDYVDLHLNCGLEFILTATGNTFTVGGEERPYTEHSQEGSTFIIHCPENY